MTTRSTAEEASRGFPLLRYFIVGTGFLFLAIAAFYLTENFGGQRAWEKEKARLAAAGESLDLEDFFPDPSRIPVEENGATVSIFADLFAGHSSTAFEWSRIFAPSYLDLPNISWTNGSSRSPKLLAGSLLIKSDKSPPKTEVDAAQWVLDAMEVDADNFNEIEEALSRPYFVEPSSRNVGFENRFPHLTLLQSHARMAVNRALCRIAAGESEAAREDVRRILHSTRFSSEPTLLSALVSITITVNAIQPLWFGLATQSWTEPELRAMDVDLAKINPTTDLRCAIRGERAFFCSMIDSFAKDRSKLRDGLIPNQGSVTFLSVAASALIWLSPKGWFHQNQVTYATETQSFLHRLDKTPFGAMPPFSAVKRTPYNALAQLAYAPNNTITHKIRHTEAILAQARTAIALELFRQSSGHLPASLAELSPASPPDPMTGAPLLYERVDDTRYKLWSVATNGIDDGGETGPSKTTTRALDWVWQSWINEEGETSSE